MAMLAPRNILWHVTLVYTLHSQICQNGFYFTNKNALDDSTLLLGGYAQQVCVSFYNRIYPAIRDFQSQEVHYKSLLCTTLIPHEGPIGELPFGVAEGLTGGEALPSYCAAILTLRTGFSGKSNRGRLYFAGIAEDDAADSLLLPDAFTKLENIGGQLLNNYGLFGSDPDLYYIVFSKKFGYSSGGVWSAAGIRQVQQTIPRRNLGTQRHRLIGKGT